MFALIAAFLFVLATFKVTIAETALLAPGLFFFALHFLIPLWFGVGGNEWFRRGSSP